MLGALRRLGLLVVLLLLMRPGRAAAQTDTLIIPPSYLCDPADPACTSLYTVAVTPDEAYDPARAPSTSGYQVSFTVINVGSRAQTYALSCLPTAPVTSCTLSATSSGSLAANGGSMTVTATYAVGASPGTGIVRVRASNTNAQDDGTVNVPVVTYGVQVTPDNSAAQQPAGTRGGATFTIQNTGSATTTFQLACAAGGTIIGCSGRNTITIGAGASDTAQLVVDAGGAGTGTLTLNATIAGVSGVSDGGSFAYTVVSYGVAVTPDNGTTASRPANTSGYSGLFTVRNTGSGVNTYSFICGGTGGVTCVPGGIAPASLQLQPNDSSTVTVPYSVGGPGSGSLTLTASGTLATDGGTYTVPITAGVAPTITLVVPTQTSAGRAVVRNRQPLLRALFTVTTGAIDTTLTVLTWRGVNVTALSRHQRGLLEWEPDSTSRLAIGDSALMAVTACTGPSACATATRWVVLPNDQRPVLGFQGMPQGANTPSFAGPFGPGLALSGAEVETGIATPSYTSMGRERSAGLVYSTRTSYPRALVPIDVELPWPAGTPDRLTVRLRDGATILDTVSVATATCTTGAAKRCRTVLQGDFSAGSFPTPTRKWLTVEVQVLSGATSLASTDSVEVFLVDRRTTRYGSGWWPASVSRLVSAGDDRLLVGPTGLVSVYRGNGDSTYVPNVGNYTALVRTGSGWELRPRGSLAKVVFDAQGRQITAIDQNDNRDSVRYAGTTDSILAFTDPVGKTISLTYVGGKLRSFTDPGGRQTQITISAATNQLTRDSLPSPATAALTRALAYRTYPGTGTVVLTTVTGVIGDITTVTYDSTFRRRPTQVSLPQVKNEIGTNINPVIAYTALERRGFRAFLNLDSTYVQVTDPLSNWTRSLVNRWGQQVRAWDALGVLARAQYSPTGLQQWAEGPNGDSSRVYSGYDVAGRFVKTWIDRGGSIYRTDSLTYDSNHRVVWRRDGFGGIVTFEYDSRGNTTAVNTFAGSTFTWYRTDGLVDSVRAPTYTAATRFQYNNDWKNRSAVFDALSTKVDSVVFDAVGRDSIHVTQVTIGTGLAVPRAVRQLRNAVNQVTASQSRQDGAWDSALTDSTALRQTSYIFDRAGRDSVRINERGKQSTTVLDRLGRVIRYRVWNDSTAVRDSAAYDAAGNLRVEFTRRGYRIAHVYDSRNRPTIDSIPTVGVVNRTYGGPQNQLTRAWLTGAVDSIGGVNGELRNGYDVRGRLLADTAYRGSVPLRTGYAYDSSERLRSITDTTGTWAYTYLPSGLNLIYTIASPFADTTQYNYDGQWRPQQIQIVAGSTTYYSWGTTYGQSGSRLQEQTLFTKGLGQFYTGHGFLRPASDIYPLPLAPTWFWENQTTGLIDSLRQVTSFDGWNRARGRESRFYPSEGAGHLQTATDTAAFDLRGNLTGPTYPATYDATTEQWRSNSATYDRSGNLTSIVRGTATWTYTYDALERLTAARENGLLVARYGYDLQGRRIAKRVYRTNTQGQGFVGYLRFIYQGEQVAFETDSAGTVGYRYRWGLGADQLVGFRAPTGEDYLVATDALNSVRSIGRRDGTLVGYPATQAYGFYGYPQAKANAGSFPQTLRYRWTGREFDAETGLYFHRTRYFDPSQGRFTQQDPIGYAGGSNLYGYVDGQVLTAIDPSGTECSPVYDSDGWLLDISCSGGGGGGPGRPYRLPGYNSWGSVGGLAWGNWLYQTQNRDPYTRPGGRGWDIYPLPEAARAGTPSFIDQTKAFLTSCNGNTAGFLVGLGLDLVGARTAVKLGKKVLGAANGLRALAYGANAGVVRRQVAKVVSEYTEGIAGDMFTGKFYLGTMTGFAAQKAAGGNPVASDVLRGFALEAASFLPLVGSFVSGYELYDTCLR